MVAPLSGSGHPRPTSSLSTPAPAAAATSASGPPPPPPVPASASAASESSCDRVKTSPLAAPPSALLVTGAASLSPAARTGLAAMQKAKAWDYPSMVAGLHMAPLGERAAVVAAFEASFRAREGVSDAPIFVLLEARATTEGADPKVPLREPSTPADCLAQAGRLCRPAPATIADLATSSVPQAPLARLERALHEAAGVAKAQHALADALFAKHDARSVFCRVYSHVTEREILSSAVGKAPCPWLSLACIQPFHRMFADNVALADARAASPSAPGPEPHWDRAFRDIEKACAYDAKVHMGANYVLDALVPAMFAHIEGDLGRGIQEAYRSIYDSPSERARVPLKSLSAQFFAMGKKGGVFDHAKADFAAKDAAKYGPDAALAFQHIPDKVADLALLHGRTARFVAGLAMPVAQTLMPVGSMRSFDMGTERTHAWDRALVLETASPP